MSATRVQANPSSVSQKQAVDNAKAAFAKLPGGEALFQQCIDSNEPVHEIVESLYRKCGVHKRKKFTRVLTGFQRYTSWMNSIAGSIDVAVQASSGIACPVWAPIKFVLKVSQDHLEATEKSLAVIQAISDNLPRLDIYEQLHDDPQFQIALVNIFTDVVEFAVKAYQYFRHRASIRLVHIIRSPFQDEFGAIVSRIESRTRSVDSLASALSQVRAAEFFNDTQAKMQKERRIRCVQWLRPSNVRESHQCNIASRVSTTCEWILEHSVFKGWIDADTIETTARVMVVQGPAGCGKSTLGSFIFDMLEQRPQPPLATREITALFSFSIGDTNRGSSDSMIRTLLSQIFEQDRDAKLLPLFEELMTKGPPSSSEIFKALEDAIKILSCPIRCVIDGVDESSESSLDIYGRLLETARNCSNLHIVLLGRPQAFTRDPQPSVTVPGICITPDINHDDVRTFIDTEIVRCTKLSDSLRNTVSDSLLKKADGMFLWVKLMFDELKRAATDEETMQRLDDLPHGLEEAYRHILHRLLTTIDKRQVESVRILLSLVITCGRPLETEELRWAYAMMVKPASESSIERCLLRLPPDQIIDICGGLLIFNGSVFDVIHSSARDFLSRPVEYWSDIESQRISIFRVLSGDSHAALSDACLSYLMDVECGQLPWEDVTSLNDLQSPPPLLRYACSYAAYHMNRSEISANQMMGKVRKVLESEQFFFAIEYLLMIVITDSSLQLHIEAFILIRTLCLANGGIGELLNAFTTRWEHEYSMRVTRFGQFDPRTQRCIASRDSLLSLRSFDSSLLMFGTPLEAHEESSESGKDADVGLHVTTSPAVLASQPSKLLIVRESLRPKQSRNISEVRGQAADSTRPGFEHLEDLLRASHDISLGRQFQVFARLINQMATVRKVIDPLKSLWQYIKNRATSMPVLLLAAAARYYMGFDKDEECLELCNICLARLTDQDVILKTYIDHLVGYTHRHLGNYDKAIQHLLAALPIEEELLGNSHILLQELRLSLAWSYSAIEKDEQNLQILDDILREGFDDNPRSSVLNRSSSISESAQGVVHHSGFTTRQLRKGFRYYYQSRKLHDTYDIRLKRLEIGAHYDRGEVISSLKGVEEALPDLEKCLDIGYGIPETSRTQAIILDMLLAHLSIGRCQRDKNQDEEVLATVRQIQELRKMHKETLYAADEANLNLLCGYGLNVNIRRLKVSDQSAKDALQDSIASVCKTFGAVDCAEEIDIWYEVAYTKLVGDVEDNPGTSVEIISIYRRFLDSYSELHAKEPLRTLHRKPKLYIAYYRLGHLYDKAGLDLDAVEAWKICLQICGDLWTSTSDAELFSYFVMGWHRLSSSYCFLQRYSESFKAAQKALNLAEGYPEMHEHLVYTIDKFRDNLVRACDRLSKYGTIFAPDGNSLDEGSGYEASSCDDSDDDLSSNNSCHVFNELHCGE